MQKFSILENPPPPVYVCMGMGPVSAVVGGVHRRVWRTSDAAPTVPMHDR